MTQLVEMDRARALRRLGDSYTVVLGFVWEQAQHLVPINVVLDGTELWFRSGPGTKLDAAHSGTRMAVCAHETDVVEHRGWSVAAEGEACVVIGGPSGDVPRRVRPWLDEALEGTWVRLRLDRVSGREIVPG